MVNRALSVNDTLDVPPAVFDNLVTKLNGPGLTFAPKIGTTATTAVAGNDARLTDARTPTTHTHTASHVTDSTVVGRSVLTAADAPAARGVIGAGTSSLALGTTGTTAAAGNDARLTDARTPVAHTSALVTDFTEAAQDAVAALLVDGAGVPFSYNDVANTLTITGSGGSGVSVRTASAVVYSSTFPAALKPATDAAARIWTCDGVSDEVEINAAISAVRGTTGTGKVQLVGDFFAIGASILLKTGINLAGEGTGTELRAATGFGAGMVQLFDAGTHLTKLTDLWINGNDQAVHGVLYDASGGQVFTERPSSNPDPSHIIRDLYIQDCGTLTFAGHAMILRGGNLRAGKYSDIRALSNTGCGVWVDGSVDSHYTNIEIGSSGAGGPAYSALSTAPVGHGFFVSQGDNNMFMSCKAWFSRGAGFYNRGSRNGYSNCQAQDNYSHGFHGLYGKTSWLGCHADSNGQADGADGRGRAGFYLGGSLSTVQGCESFDKAEGGTAWEQWYGFQFTSGFAYSRVTGCVTYGNGAVNVTGGGSRFGTAGTGTTVDIVADANGG